MAVKFIFWLFAIYNIIFSWYDLRGDIMLECRLKKIVRVKHTIPITIDFQTHSSAELTYFIRGNGTTQINDKVYSYKNNTFAFYKSGTLHNEIDPENCDIIWLHFDYNIEGVELLEGVFNDSNGELLQCLLRLRNSSISQSKYADSLTESILAECITLAAVKQNEEETLPSTLDFERIIDYIDDNISTDIDFSKIAQESNYSYHRFRHLFKMKFGVSCYNYITTRRIEYAKHLLKNSNALLTDIAYDSGFNSSSQFANIFKKYVGQTPGEYRKLHNAQKGGV